ncbi:cardiolipin synthase [Solitalea sp. MAHUQ-68]|uniref:Cardiolipin synthase n=1 Tax=Solitalea agri TaxID=2953739 RepID=A0A9X2F0T8_9SPHI|nr:cardiolipin synthase [Solitalea agri]MCO4292039.1 cardiolipin synthase [Solitalea agri]
MQLGNFFTEIWHQIPFTTLFLAVGYLVAFVFSVIVISENRSPTKTMAYLLIFFLLPVVGIVIYYVFGENYRKKKLYGLKALEDEKLQRRINNYVYQLTEENLKDNSEELKDYERLVRLLTYEGRFPLTDNNKVSLLINGEEKFPALFEALEKATHHIHLEYYIIEEGHVVDRLFEILIRKAQQGVQVRLIYDDFGCSLSKKFLKQIKEAGIQAIPFYKIHVPLLSNRQNYRDHRKIVVIDGLVGFVGGINLSDKYLNVGTNNELFWRDTHLKIEGESVRSLQLFFALNWSFCCEEELFFQREYFPDHELVGKQMVQTAVSGPDSDRASIMLSYLSAINNAKHCIYITTPYFIPNESIVNALKNAALSRLDVRLLVPGKSDSKFVNAASQSYYQELLECGVRIFRYQKGFVHAKTMVVDDLISMVGTANIDIRSFDLNFEVNAIVFDQDINTQLKQAFMNDLSLSREISTAYWHKRRWFKHFFESLCRLLSPIL